MRQTTRSIALLGATGALAAPAAIALADAPARAPGATRHLHATLGGQTLREQMRRAERRHRRLRRARRAREAQETTSAASPALQAIAACESGGDPHAIGGGGAFRGKYQFTYASWQAVGGTGDPADAPEAEQDRRAEMLMARSGTGSWPVCG